jgi:predicted acetyltransferase
MDLVLRVLVPEDGPAAWYAHTLLAKEGYEFLLDSPDPSEPFDDYLARLARTAKGDVVPGRVRADFFVAESAGEIVGRLSIRHELSPTLRALYGHIGYMVLPQFRRRGVATYLLSAGVEILSAEGVKEILVSCDDTNIGSAAVIERCGGVLLNRVEQPGTTTLLRRYHIVPAQVACSD